MTFQSLDLPGYLIAAIEKLSYEKPTAIQEQAIPLILEGQDLIAESQTGSGKTAAFALPVIKLLNDLPPKKNNISVQVLAIAPTRELALQVSASFKAYAQFSPNKLKVVSLIGGEPIDLQIRSLDKGADVAVATPGRLLDLIDHEEIRLSELRVLIFDEADKILDQGFSEQIDTLLENLPEERQNLLFSATLPQKVVKLSEKFLKDPSCVTIDNGQTAVDVIHQRVIEVDPGNRRLLLQHLITGEKWNYALIFVASKRAAHNLAVKLNRDGIEAEALHGDLDQSERILVLDRFKNRAFPILIATDLACRGLDIHELSYVVNYDLPRSPSDYVHRIGRTGRAGHSGTAISFIDHDTRPHFQLIEKRAGIQLGREKVEGFELSGEAPVKAKNKAPIKGKRKSKKDKLREQAKKAAK